jgi:nicotinamidase-related amidase
VSSPANFKGAIPTIDVNDAAMLLIDHQSGLFQTVADMPMTTLRAHAAALAKAATGPPLSPAFPAHCKPLAYRRE